MSDSAARLLLVSVICLAICCRPLPARDVPGAAGPLCIGSRLELFVDDWLIERMTGGLRWKLHSPRMAETVLRFDKPWEGPTSAYVRVFEDEGRYRMYYRGGLGAPRGGPPGFVCYAESTDGIRWRRPELNLVDFQGSKRNNIVWKGIGTHCSLGVFKDTNPRCKPAYRYKAFSGKGYKRPVYALGSPDGLRWQLIRKEPIITEFRGAAAAYDSHFCAWWDEVRKKYVMYHRMWYRPVEPKVRNIAMRTSGDLVHWSPMRRLDFGDTPPEHLYTAAVVRYFRAPHILLAFPKRFLPGRKVVPEAEYGGISDAVFMSSRDGIHFDRRFMEAFVRPGRDRLNWTSRTNMIATGILPTGPDEISIYISQHYNFPTGHLRRAVLRTDGFVSVHAPYKGGELLTKPLVFAGKQLVINYVTSAAGSIRVELVDDSGKPVGGFGVDDCPEIYGDQIERVVSWKGGSDVSALAGKPIRLRFHLRDADLYSIRFR